MSMNIRMRTLVGLNPLDWDFMDLIEATSIDAPSSDIYQAIEPFSLFIPDSILNKSSNPKNELRIKENILDTYVYQIDDYGSQADSAIAYTFDMIRALWYAGYDFGITTYPDKKYDYRTEQYMFIFDVCEKLLASKHIDDVHRRIITKFAAEAASHWTDPESNAHIREFIMITPMEFVNAKLCAKEDSVIRIDSARTEFSRVVRVLNDTDDYVIIQNHPELVKKIYFNPSLATLNLDDIRELLAISDSIKYYEYENQYFKIIGF